MSCLSNLNVLFLGSSVTRGEFSEQMSFVEYLHEKHGFQYTKEAVSGTTLIDNGETSYISRLKKINPKNHYDLFICQLSTNDAYLKIPLGDIQEDSFDTSLVTGAIQYIVQYVKDTFHCKVVFYTGAYYENPEYERMVIRLQELSQIMDFSIIDMFSDKDFNSISKETYNEYMRDPVHPNKYGYYAWWGPYMEHYLLQLMEN